MKRENKTLTMFMLEFPVFMTIKFFGIIVKILLRP